MGVEVTTNEKQQQQQRQYEICLIGSGGVGTIASVVLEKSGKARVTVVLRSKYAVVKEKGWDIDSVDHGELKGWRPSRVVANVDEAASYDSNPCDKVPYDYIVVATKQLPEIYSIAEMIKPLVTPNLTSVVLFQNGIDIELPIITAFPTVTVMSVASMIGSKTVGDNQVIQTGKDQLDLGTHFHEGLDRRLQADRTQNFIDMYNEGGAFECKLAEDVAFMRWKKLIWNGTFNTICTLMQMDVGELQSSGGRETLLLPAMWEMYAIAKATGCILPKEIIPEYAYRLPDTCDYRPSMLLDRDHGRATELEVILGNPLKRAKQYGVATPVLSTVYELLKMARWKDSKDGRLNK